MRLELLISTMNADPRSLVNKMNVSSDAIIINQTDHTSFESFSFKGHNIRVWSFAEKGIGISRNNALMRSNADVVLFADDDAILVDDYEQKIIEEFDRKPESDFIIVNYDVKCTNGRKGAINATKRKRVHWWNSQRYGTCRFAIRRDKVIKKNIFFSLLYGASKYSHGEDSIFIMDCLKKQLKVYTSNINVGVLDCNNSSWFNSYNEKYFFDTGALMYAINPFFYKKERPVYQMPVTQPYEQPFCQSVGAFDAAQKVICINCGRELLPDEVFCAGCGTRRPEPPQTEPDAANQKVFCSGCGRELPPDEDFCCVCGTRRPNPLQDETIDL